MSTGTSLETAGDRERQREAMKREVDLHRRKEQLREKEEEDARLGRLRARGFSGITLQVFSEVMVPCCRVFVILHRAGGTGGGLPWCREAFAGVL